MGERIRRFDWAATPLGPVSAWPQSLRTAVDLMLDTRQPAAIAWGPALTCLYNDAAIPVLGAKHPEVLGRPAGEFWAGIWPAYRSAMEATLAGEAPAFVDQPVTPADGLEGLTRWFTFSLAPIRSESGAIPGVFCTGVETTERVLKEAGRSAEEERLRLSDERYRSFVAHSTEGIWLLELDPPIDTALGVDEQIEQAYRNGRFVDCNDAMARMYGLDRAEDLIGKTLDFPFPATNPEARAYFIEIIRSGYNLVDIESVEQDAEGNRKHFANSMLGVVENGLLKHMWGIQRDITDRKQADEHRTLLINELNHRVKNTLATVQSIATQTLRNTESPAAAREAIEGRLIALSRAHNVLTRENWEGAGLTEIVEQGIAPYMSGGEDRIRVSGQNVRLPPRMALAFAMMLQELATNAVKYGALSGPAGHVALSWEVQAADPPRLLLRWEESGGPPVEAPTRRGFGTRLVERSLAQELGGTVEIAFAPAGIVCSVDAPLG
jgi:PAS domain S-box-containing protein